MGCGPLQFICDAVGGAVGSTVGGVASAGFEAIAKSFAEAAQTMCGWMWSAISATTTVDLSGAWFAADLKLTATIAAVMVLALFVLQLIKGLIRRDPQALGRAVTGGGVAFLGAGAAVIVTGTLLALTDELSDGVVHTAGLGDVAAMGRRLAPAAALSTGSMTPALVIVLSVFFVIASVLVWAVFLIRKALLIVAVVFAPVAFGGAANDATRGWVRKWVEFTLAMIFSKLVIVVIFTIALSLVGASGGGVSGASGLITGLLLLVLACFAPWLVFKLVHFVGGDVLAAHHTGALRDVRTAGGTAAAVATGARGAATKVFASSPAAATSTVPRVPAAVPVFSGVDSVSSRAAPDPSPAGRPTSAPDGPTAGTEPVTAATTRSAPRPVTRLSRHQVDWGEAT